MSKQSASVFLSKAINGDVKKGRIRSVSQLLLFKNKFVQSMKIILGINWRYTSGILTIL